jgi:hypothetical protein
MIPRSAVATWLALAALRLLTLEGPARAIFARGHPVATAERRHYRPAAPIDGQRVERVRPSHRGVQPGRADSATDRDSPAPLAQPALVAAPPRQMRASETDDRARLPGQAFRQLPPARAPPARV